MSKHLARRQVVRTRREREDRHPRHELAKHRHPETEPWRRAGHGDVLGSSRGERRFVHFGRVRNGRRGHVRPQNEQTVRSTQTAGVHHIDHVRLRHSQGRVGQLLGRAPAIHDRCGLEPVAEVRNLPEEGGRERREVEARQEDTGERRLGREAAPLLVEVSQVARRANGAQEDRHRRPVFLEHSRLQKVPHHGYQRRRRYHLLVEFVQLIIGL